MKLAAVRFAAFVPRAAVFCGPAAAQTLTLSGEPDSAPR
jgi:hypothetical protein